MGLVTWQKFLAHWMQHNYPLLKHLQKIIQADYFLRARRNYFSECEIKGPYDRFDLLAEKCVRLCPLATAFSGNILSMTKAEFSAVQLDQYLRIILGPEFRPRQTSNGNGKCFCGQANDSPGS
jgi:hypothetical protein